MKAKPKGVAADLASRLSGECPLMRHYVRGAARPSPAPGPGPGKPSGPYPRRKLPRAPQPHPSPKKAPVPFRPYTPPRRPFGTPPKVGAPVPGQPIGGLAKSGFRFLRRTPALTLGFLVLDWLNQPRGEYRPHDLALYGFRRLCAVPPNGGYAFNPGIPYSGPDTRAKFNGGGNPGLACTVAAQVADDNMTNGTSTLPVGTEWVAYGPDNHQAIVRMQLREQWLFPQSSGTPVAIPPTMDPFAPPSPFPVAPVPLPYPYPQIDPFIFPPFSPQPIPNPIPYRAIPHRRPNPWRDPNEQPSKDAPGKRKPRQVRRTRLRPSRLPVEETVVTPGNKPGQAPTPRPGVHVRRPPLRAREREKKGKFSIKNGTALAELLGIVTESLDLLDAFFKALPWKVQQQYTWKGSNPWERAVFVAENLEHVRIGTLVTNITSMLLEDAAFGKLGRISAKVNQSLHKNFGVDLQGRHLKPYNQPLITVPAT